MPDNDLIRRSLDAGMAFTELTRQRAETIVKDLVRAGELNQKQATARVEELLERSRQQTEALIAVVRKEIDERVAQLNLVTIEDLQNLAARLGLPVKAAPAGGPEAPAAAPKAATPKAAAPKVATPKVAAPVKPAPVASAPTIAPVPVPAALTVKKAPPAKKAPAAKKAAPVLGAAAAPTTGALTTAAPTKAAPKNAAATKKAAKKA